MVSEPNFVLGIKQTSLHNKEDSHVHITIRSQICLSAGSRLHGISQPPWRSAVSKIHKLKQSRDLTFQICAHQAFACRNQHHRRAPRSPTTKTQKSGHLNPSHAPPRAFVASGKSPTRRHTILTSRLYSGRTRRPVGLLVRRSTKPAIPARIRDYTRSHAPP